MEASRQNSIRAHQIKIWWEAMTSDPDPRGSDGSIVLEVSRA